MVRFSLFTVFREPLLRAVVIFLFAPRFEAVLRVPDERVRELRALRAAGREVLEEEAARALRDLDPELVERDDRIDDLRLDLPVAREPDALRFERAEVRDELLLLDRERPVPPLACLLLLLRLAPLCARAARVPPCCEDLPRLCRVLSRLISLLKLLFSPPAVVSW